MRVAYFFNKALKNIIRNFSLNVFSVLIISSSLILLNLFFLISYNLGEFIKQHTSREIIVYLEEGAENKDIKTYREKLDKILPNDKEFKFVNNQRALEIFKKELKNNSDILKNLPSDILPSYFRIKFSKEIKITDNLIKSLKDLYFVNDVSYGKKAYKKLEKIKSIISKISYYILIFIIIITVFTIYTTIKLTIYSRKDEISTLELVGATQGFIIFPFYIEGILQALVSSLLSLISLYSAFKFSISDLAVIMPQNIENLKFLPPVAIVLNLIAVTLLGIVSSHISVKRFLKI